MAMPQYPAIAASAIQSTVAAGGELRIELADRRLKASGQGEVTIAVRAAPVHPADLMLLLAGADPHQARFVSGRNSPIVSSQLSTGALAAAQFRIASPLGVGLEGAGMVVAAGKGAEELLGKRVAFQCREPASFATHVTVDAAACLLLPDDVTWQQGAAAFCNPLTALAMVETLHQTGQSAMIHTAAASSIGQMLVHICREDGIGLVNVVRRPEQADLMRKFGAIHVCDSSTPDFADQLAKAISAVQARVAFDAIGGGTMACTLLAAMEACAVAGAAQFNPYGSMEAKTVNIYGRLDPSPTVIPPSAYGMVWSVEGWAMPPILARAGPERTASLMERVRLGLKSTFACKFRAEITLEDLLGREILVDCCRKETGGKYLIRPTRD